MSAQQIKDRPASALRAMFAGIGSLLSKDKSTKDGVRTKPAAEAPADVEAPAPAAATPEKTVELAAETVAAPETVAETEVVAEAEAVAVAAAPETAVEPETAVAPEAAAELPLANYDELTVASLRARLRNLSNDDLLKLRAYEEAHQNRPEVIKMFQNRFAKMTSSFQKLEA